jgi:TonB family protein
MPNIPQSAEPTLANVDRRLCARRLIPSLAYVELGEDNGGIILNISENGLAVTSVAPLYADGLKRMRFRLPGSSDWLEERGDFAWISESKKNAGIRFVDLSEDARNRIRDWVFSEASPVELRSEGVRVGEKAWRHLEMPTIHTPQSTPPQPTNPDRVPQVPVQVSMPTPNAAVFDARTSVEAPAIVVLSARLRGGTEHKPRVEAGDGRREILARRRSWGIVALIAILGALLLSGWFTAGPRSGILGRFRKAKLEAVETANGGESRPASSVASVSTPSAQSAPPRGDESNTGAEARSYQPAPASRNTNVGSSSIQITHPQQHVLEPFSAGTSANVPSPQAENRSPRGPAGAAAQPKDTSVATPLSPNVNQPEGARAASTAEQENSPPPKPAENPEIAKTSVSVSISLYPSIRVPTGLKPQVSRQGASLKIGQLLSRVDPRYPEDAETQEIEGTVKLHVIIGQDGTIQSVEQTSGPVLLVPAATNAVRQWLFTPSFVEGQPVQAEGDITITFRLLKQTAQPN